MRERGWWSALMAVMWFFPTAVFGQEEPDSLVSYDLSEIIIGGEVRHNDAAQRLFRVGLAELSRQDKSDVGSVLRILPSAHLQTNSRGETLVYIRGAGERQVAVFLDGAPINIGWDNRVDLSMLPANVLGGITLERGAVSPAYGPNVVGGAVNLNSRSLSGDTAIREGTLQVGTPEAGSAKALFARKNGNASVLIGGTISTSDGARVSKSARLPFGQSEGLRTNSDKTSATVYGRWDVEKNLSSLGVTVFHTSSEKGVSPEGHVNPTEESVRYWRYPVWKNTMAIVNGTTRKYPIHLFTSVWAAKFQQHIDQYESDQYEKRIFRQEDLDLTAGFRGVAEWKSGNASYRGIGFISTTKHDQTDLDVSNLSNGVAQAAIYSNVLYSVGAEVAIQHSMDGQWVIGASLDGMNTPLTGDKPSQPALRDWSVNLEGDLNLSERVEWVVNVGSKPRFPTLRELYGVALNRFELNPDLTSERVWMAETGFRIQQNNFASEVTGFVQRTSDAIDQENIVVDGQNKRRRVNLDGSRVWGIELSGAYRPSSKFSVEANGTWLRPVALTSTGNKHLTEKPEMMVTVQSSMAMTPSLRFSASLYYLGTAFGLMPNNDQVALPTSTEINVRFSKSHYFSNSGIFLEGFVGADNVFDALTLPQLGLPAPGRSARLGVNLSY